MSEGDKPPEGMGPGQQEAGALPAPLAEEPVDQLPPTQEIQQQREDARLTFTVVMLLVFGAQLLVGALAVFAGPESWGRAEEYLRVTLPATLGILGSAIGFYFGSQR